MVSVLFAKLFLEREPGAPLVVVDVGGVTVGALRRPELVPALVRAFTRRPLPYATASGVR